ncbi:hypothetical protein N7454_002983 [Penicillium verhagenii]|nr:hypothetical protein N7454_002983 [Penicillium verhagenii]
MKLSWFLLLGTGAWVVALPATNLEVGRSMDEIAWPESYAEKRDESQARSMDDIAWPESYAEK